ncbi:MAG TPA: molybdenum cofactor guanylyltransferase [Vicinamibacterales bacterium]|nr:molybdenum cofactor guanylyltransferase [Vicinamibacterales bacterium]
MISAAILAGGRATRFGGRDKGALVVDGRPIVERQREALSTVSDDVRIVREDIVPGCGPLGGVHAALTRARHTLVFVLACDMPYITAPFVSYLCSIADSWDIVVPRTERGYHPLSALYRRTCLAPVARRLAGRQLRMTDLFSDVRVREITGEELDRFGGRDRLLTNVNTPAELAGLETLQGHKL